MRLKSAHKRKARRLRGREAAQLDWRKWIKTIDPEFTLHSDQEAVLELFWNAAKDRRSFIIV